MQWTRTHCCTSHCMAQEWIGALRLIRIVIHVMRLSVVCSLLIPHLVPFRVFLLFLLLLLPKPWPVPLPLPYGLHRGNIPLALRQLKSLTPWPKMPLSHMFWAPCWWSMHPRKWQHIYVPQPDLLQNTSVCKHFRFHDGPVRTGTVCHQKKRQPLAYATRRSRPRWACRSRRQNGAYIGCARRARWCRTALGDNAARKLVCVSCFSCYLSHIGRIVCDLFF